ncbi:MAG: DUF5686 family protein [Bacteroidia bacterium]
MSKSFFFLFLLIWFNQFCNAQTIVTGRVFDSNTNEPLPFINVFFKSSNVGCQSDFDGIYKIAGDVNTDSIVFTYLGYNRKAVFVKKDTSQKIDVQLESSTISLQEIVIKPGENPAHRILKNVIKNKKYNNIEKLDSYEFEVYSKFEVDLNNVPKKMINRKTVKPFRFVFQNIDSTNKNEKPYLPMFISENVSDFFYRKNPKTKKEIIKGSKTAGISDQSVAQVLGNMNYYTNIYDNSFLLFGKKFTSPISDNGLLFYKYYLIDSLFIDGKWCYQLQFKPKRKEELAFNGNIWINDSTWGVKRFEMSIAKEANINFINGFSFAQEFVFIDSVWMLQKDRMVADVALIEKTMGGYGRKTTSYKNFVINKPREDKFFKIGENTIIQDGSTDRSADFWSMSRHDTLSKNEEVIYKMVDTIQTIRAFRRYRDFGKTLYTGYYVYKKFEYGPYFTTYSFNRVEGSRIRIGGRTSNDFSKWIEFSGYGAYGFKDDKYKYSIGARGFLNKKPHRTMYLVNYKKDYEVLGQSINAFRQDNIIASFFRRNPLTNLTLVESYRAHIDHEWFSGFNSRIALNHRKISPVAGNVYKKFSQGSYIDKANIQSSEITFSTRFAWNEKFLNGEFERISLGTTFPVLQVAYTAGLKGVFNSDYNFHKLYINISDRYRQNPIGYIDYMFEAGKIWGTIAYPLLDLHPGNETYAYDIYAFNLMNYLEFGSDQYLIGTATHHFDGFFLNKIPLFKKLKWRELVAAKVVWGNISTSNQMELLLPTTLSSLKNLPYAEAGFGIENIFKFFRVDALWRLTYIDKNYISNYQLKNPGSGISKFGIRATFQASF